MQKHNMKLLERPFTKMQNGDKLTEFRLFDKKRQEVQVGDYIEFSKLPQEKERLFVQVEELYQYPTFKDLLSYLGYSGEDLEEKVQGMYSIYSPEKETELGVLGIKIKLLEELKDILELNKSKRISVVGTTCTGKTTFLNTYSQGQDMDKLIFPLLSQEESDFVCQTPWTEEIGTCMNKLVKERVQIQPGQPVFGTVVIDSDLLVYLDISGELLKQRTSMRNVNFEDAMNMNNKILSEIENSGIPYTKVSIR